MIGACLRHPLAGRRPTDGLCASCVKNRLDVKRRKAQREALVQQVLPDAPCTMTTTHERIVLVGEVTAAAWDGVADALAQRIDEPSVTLDLAATTHARTMPSRVASYVSALRQRGADVAICASAYVRACVQASRFGAELDVRWVAP